MSYEYVPQSSRVETVSHMSWGKIAREFSVAGTLNYQDTQGDMLQRHVLVTCSCYIFMCVYANNVTLWLLHVLSTDPCYIVPSMCEQYLTLWLQHFAAECSCVMNPYKCGGIISEGSSGKN